MNANPFVNTQRLQQICRMFLFVIIALTGTACSDAVNEEEDNEETTSYLPITQNDLPFNKGHLNILAIGNSYTEDGTTYTNEILEQTRLTPESYSIYSFTWGGSSLDFWANQIANPDSTWFVCRAGKGMGIKTKRDILSNVVALPWDVIVLQQVSTDAVDYATYNPGLHTMLLYLQAHCPNKDVAIAWQMIHAYGKSHPALDKGDNDTRWSRIVEATQQMMQTDGIRHLIPTGTAIQIARHTNLNTPYDLTRDNTHLCYGIGRYIAACTWVESLFQPVFGITVEGNTAVHNITVNEWDDKHDGFIPESCIPVNAGNRLQCQQIAIQACRNPFNLN